jgi:AcrR family transcriptional regulator
MSDNIRTFSRNNILIEQRRREIVFCAAKLFVENGYDRTTIREICRAMNISSGRLYHYVASKEDILHLVLEFFSEGLAKGLSKFDLISERLTPTEVLREAIRVNLEDIDKFQDMHIIINHLMLTLEKSQRQAMFSIAISWADYYEKLLLRGIESGDFNIDDPYLLAAIYIAGIH